MPPAPMVDQEIKKIMKFWLDQGVDGFRVDMSMSLVNRDPDKNDPDLLLNRVRALIKTRLSFKALQADTNFEVIYAESGWLPFVYTRAKQGKKLMVALNPSNRDVSVTLPKDLLETIPETLDGPDAAAITPTDEG